MGWKLICINPESSPCDGCKRRVLRCHGRCRDYAEFRDKCDNARKKRRLRLDVNYAIGDAMKRIPGIRRL